MDINTARAFRHWAEHPNTMGSPLVNSARLFTRLTRLQIRLRTGLLR